MSDETSLTKYEIKNQSNRLVKGVKNITDFFSEAIDAFKGIGFPDAIEKAAPWAGAIGEATAEALPPLKFITKLAEEFLKETDPEKLGLTACTIAYQHAAAKAIKEIGGPTDEKRAIKEAKEQLFLIPACEDVDISTFSIEDPLKHDFIERANLHLEIVGINIGYTRSQTNTLIAKAQEEFTHSLSLLLTDGSTKDKFTPFTEYLKLGAGKERQSRKLLAAHANYLRWLYEEAPVLGRSPFALKDVYINTECGKLNWKDIKSNQSYRSEEGKKDPFDEKHGGRQDLIKTVLDLIGADKDFDQVIVVQGFAGMGKSSFTLKLCDELLKRHLHPIRIRIRDLSFYDNLRDAMPKAVLKFSDENYPGPEPPTMDDLFLSDSIFSERGIGEYSHISKRVLIFDGWDEISVTNEGFKEKVKQMLEQINAYYLGKNPRIRVILTGRPSSDIGDTNCLREKTPILTIRPLKPKHLKDYIGKIREAVNAKEPRIKIKELDKWTMPSLNYFKPIFKKYQEAFNQKEHKSSSGVEVLGLPLLTHLAVRLISEWSSESKTDPSQLLESNTTLYKCLVDLTCSKAGKAEFDKEENETQPKFFGDDLRKLLRATASAITVYGEENIPRKELSLRLKQKFEKLESDIEKLTSEQKLSSLLISFYFKGGAEHLGCEFAHKSFREYLFAEAIVEMLKEYGRDQQNYGKIPPEREAYWKDFDPNDSKDCRYDFSRNLSELLAPRWLTPEVKRHLEKLIEWEIERTVNPDAHKEVGSPTKPLQWDEWIQVRAGLADLWGWWADSVHLRPQRVKDRRGNTELIEPYVKELILLSAQRDTEDDDVAYESSNSMDAHLGESLCLLCVLVHNQIAQHEETRDTSLTIKPRVHQSMAETLGGKMLLFSPSSNHPLAFKKHIARINSAFERPFGDFPNNANLSRINLSNTDLSQANLIDADLSYAYLSYASLSYADLGSAKLSYANLNDAELSYANLNDADLSNAELSGANLNDADLSYASLDEANLSNTDLSYANLSETSFRGANLSEADLSETILNNAIFDDANLSNANLNYANLSNADLIYADLTNASINQAQFNSYTRVSESIEKANFNEIDLDGERLDRETALRTFREKGILVTNEEE